MTGNTKPLRRSYDHSCDGDPYDCPYAAQTAKLAVKEVFAILGVDVENPAAVEEFRMDLRFGKMMRRRMDHGIFAIIALVAGGIVFALWAGLKVKIG